MIAYRNSFMNYALIVGSLLAVILILAATSVETIGLLEYIPLLTIITILILFYKLNTTVEHGVIVCSFGQGAVTQTIRVREIASCRVVSMPWWQFFSAGSSGYICSTIINHQGIELCFTTGKTFRISSNEADSLLEAVQDEMKKYPCVSPATHP